MKSSEQKRAEGKARNEGWRGLTSEEKLKRLALRPGNSKRQVEKLTHEIQTRDAVRHRGPRIPLAQGHKTR